MKTGKWR